MKLTRRQAKAINEMIRDEAERVINGRRLFQEGGPDMRRVDHEMVATEVENEAYDFALDMTPPLVTRIDNGIMKIVSSAINRAAVGGRSVPMLTQWDIYDIYPDEEMHGEIQREMLEKINDAIVEYARTLAKAAVEVAIDYGQDVGDEDGPRGVNQGLPPGV